MKRYSFTKETSDLRFVKEVGYDVRFDVFKIYESSIQIGSYFSSPSICFFESSGFDCLIRIQQFIFKENVITITDKKNKKEIGRFEYQPKAVFSGYYNLIISGRHYETVKMNSDYDEPAWWDYDENVKLTLKSGECNILYQTTKRRSQGKLIRCEGYFEISEDGFLIDAFAGFYLMLKAIEEMDIPTP